jgi:hypothetical protein
MYMKIHIDRQGAAPPPGQIVILTLDARATCRHVPLRDGSDYKKQIEAESRSELYWASAVLFGAS